jgi:hypothetical protein
VPVALIVLGFIGFLLWRRRRNANDSAGTAQITGDIPRDNDATKFAVIANEAHHPSKPELPAQQPPQYHPQNMAELNSPPAFYPVPVPQHHHSRSELSGNASPTSELGAAPAAHEIDHSHRRAGGGYSDLPEPVPSPVHGDVTVDPVLASLHERERQLLKRRQRLHELDRLDQEHRELQRLRDERLRQLR